MSDLPSTVLGRAPGAWYVEYLHVELQMMDWVNIHLFITFSS